jgi:hypothetical protein
MFGFCASRISPQGPEHETDRLRKGKFSTAFEIQFVRNGPTNDLPVPSLCAITIRHSKRENTTFPWFCIRHTRPIRPPALAQTEDRPEAATTSKSRRDTNECDTTVEDISKPTVKKWKDRCVRWEGSYFETGNSGYRSRALVFQPHILSWIFLTSPRIYMSFLSPFPRVNFLPTFLNRRGGRGEKAFHTTTLC